MNASVTLPTVTIQFLVFTNKQLGPVVTISYRNGETFGVTAGNEVVTVSGTTITIDIQAGTSTNAQIAAAILASKQASYLVTASPSGGHSSDTPKTCVGAKTTSGVTTAVKASLTIAGMFLRAKTAGTAGNSIRFKFTGGATAGSEVVTVSTNDISVQIEGGVSTMAQVIAALVASSSAMNKLDTPVSAGASGSSKMFVASALAFTNLTGGLAVAPAAVTVQNITLTSLTNDATQNGITLSYTTGATADSEVVSHDGSGNISVQIENGVSTATQILTALNADAYVLTLWLATTASGSTAQKTVNSSVTTGGVGLGSMNAYIDQSSLTLTSSYQLSNFNFGANYIYIVNEEVAGSSSKHVIISFDGVNEAMDLAPGEVQLFGKMSNVNGIYLKYTSAAPSYKVTAWTAQ